MAAYEAQDTIRKSVESVLDQTVGDLELIVVDDGSSVPVTAVLSDMDDRRLRIVRHARNRGLARSRNTALSLARASLVSQLDADDAWEGDYLAHVLPCFGEPAVGLAYTNATIVGHPDGHDDYIGDPAPHPIDRFPKITDGNPAPCPSVTMRTEAVRNVGGYAWWLGQTEDYHLYLKLAAAGWRFSYVHRQLARYRWPSPRSGMSYHARRHRQWELAMWASFALRHPLAPGARRQVRLRLLRETRELLRPPGRLRRRLSAGKSPLS
jgi:glycosyltransferase involved in cell wall biosynthesis